MKNPMPNLLNISLLFLFCLSQLTATGQLQGDSYASALKSKKATFIYVYDGIPGFVESQDGEMKGIVVDIMKRFEAFLKVEKGISVSSQYIYAENGDFENFMRDVRSGSGGVFGLSNISISDERKKDYSFSPPYMDNVSLLVSNGSIPTLKSMEELPIAFSGLSAYSLPGSSYLARLVQIKNVYLPSLEIVNLSSETQLMEKLASDKNAFAILDVNYYLEILNNKMNIKRHAVGDVKDDQFGVIMPRTNDWEPLIKEFFNSGFIGSSDYRQIISNNLGNSALRLLDSFKGR